MTRIAKGKIRESTTMKEGFIIIRVNATPVRTKNDLIKILKSQKGRMMIEGMYPGLKDKFYYGFGI